MSDESREQKREGKSSVSFAGWLLSALMILVVILLAALLWPLLSALLGVFWMQMQILLSWLQQYR